jgi:hypothetical protein
LDSEKVSSDYKGVHTQEWLQGVKSKTKALEYCISVGFLPLISLDVDQLVVSDFISLIPTNCSVVLCKRKQPVTRPDGLLLDYIGSFFVANNTSALQFVQSWIHEISRLEELGLNPPYETPALCRLAAKKNIDTKVFSMSDQVVSAPNIYIDGITKILHFKSERPEEESGNILYDRIICNDLFTAKLVPEYIQNLVENNLDIDDLASEPTSSKHSLRSEWDPPPFIIRKAKTLDELSIIFRSDKGKLKHNYTRFYEKYLKAFREKSPRLLEIGVANGSSLKMWSHYMKNAIIDGLDIDPNCGTLCKGYDNINIIVASASEAQLSAKYDIIIDDGSHVSTDVRRNFDNLWPLLKAGGFYFVEDTLCTNTLTQAKYNPLRDLKDYSRNEYLKLIDKLFYSMDKQGDACQVEAVHVHPQLLVISKSVDGGEPFPACVNRQYQFDEVTEIWKARLRIVVLTYLRPLARIILKFIPKL